VAARRRYGHDDLVVSEALGTQAGLALDNALLYEEQNAGSHRLDRGRGHPDDEHTEWVRGDERRRIARDLHDRIEQSFFAIELSASAALGGRAQHPSDTHLRETVARIGELSRAGAEELRAAIFALNRPECANLELTSVLWTLVRSFRQRTGIETDLVLTGSQRELPTEVADVLQSIAHETLANAERHSQARAVIVRLHFTARACTLTVLDDGVGASNLVMKRIGSSATHFGLRGLSQRVKGLHGTFAYGSAPDGGYQVRARIPLPGGSPT
jgi:signal transduction histidine kinase